MARYMEALTVERGGFRIKVPESWWEFDVRPESRDDSIHHMVTERLRAHPELAPHRDTYISFLRKAAADAWKSGALYLRPDGTYSNGMCGNTRWITCIRAG